MPINDEVKQQRAKLKGQGWKAHLSYFWDYYRIHTIVIVLVAIGIFSVGKTVLESKDTILYAVFLNCIEAPDQEVIFEEFTDYSGIEKDGNTLYIDNSLSMSSAGDSTTDMYSQQKLVVLLAAAELDVFAADSETTEKYAALGNFHDLSTILSKEFMTAHQDELLYAKNEEGQSVATAVCLTKSPKTKEWGVYQDADYYISVSAGSARTAAAVSFIEYLFE